MKEVKDQKNLPDSSEDLDEINRQFEEAYEKELKEKQNYVEMVMRTILAVIILVIATVLRFVYHINDLLINGLLIIGAILVVFYVIAVFHKKKDL